MLAIKVTPEQALQDVNGVELADSWCDWINWRYLGYRAPPRTPTGEQLVRRRPQRGHLETGVPADVPGRFARRLQRHLGSAAPADGFGPAHGLHRGPQLCRDGRTRRRARDDQPGRETRHRRRTAGRSGAGGAAGGRVRPRRLPAADRRAPRPVVALHDGRTRALRPAHGVPPVQPRLRCNACSASESGRSPSTATTTPAIPNSAPAATSISPSTAAIWRSAARPTHPTCSTPTIRRATPPRCAT